MMLTSAGQQGDGARCRELGVAAYLMKPVRQSELLEDILAALGTPSADRRSAAGGHASSLRESRQKLRILLAEDNMVNQMVAARLLEKRGHTVVIVGERERSAGSPGWAGLRRIRSGPDGRADARDGRFRGHRRSSVRERNPPARICRSSP